MDAPFPSALKSSQIHPLSQQTQQKTADPVKVRRGQSSERLQRTPLLVSLGKERFFLLRSDMHPMHCSLNVTL